METSGRAATPAGRGAPRRPTLLALVAVLLAGLLAPLAALSSAPPAAAYAGAPWFKPRVPYTANFPDPTVVWDGSKYWAYATSTGGSLMPAMSSTDLVTWTPRPAYGGANVWNSDPYFNDSYPVPPVWSSGGTSRTNKAMWGPGVVSLAGKWVAYTSWEVYPGRRCISVARADSPAGPFIDGTSQPLVCDTDPGGSIDPQPFVDSDGKAYLMWKSSGVVGAAPTKIKARQLSGDGLSFAPGSVATTILQTELPWDGNSIENPSMVRYQGQYWLIYSGNEWESADYRMGQAACAGPLGPCQRSSGSPLIQNTASEWSPGGGTLFVDNTGRLRIIYQVWNAPYTSYPTNPNCDGPGLCQSQGQRYYRIDGLAPFAGRLSVDPIGSVDSVTLSGGTITVSGWALDPSTTSPIQVHVYLDGGAVAVTADGSRPDVGAVYPGMGNAHGYTASFNAGPGTHQVCAYGIGVKTPGNPSLGCRTVVVPDSGPFGNIDSISTSLGSISVGGWAIDPDTASPISVNVIVDGALTTLTADKSRPDVGAAYPGKGNNHGWSTTIAVGGGPHQLCVVGLNVGAGGNTFLGCRSVTVPGGNPMGSMDSAAGVPGGVAVGGWAIDPDTASPIAVHVYVDGVGVATTAGQSRPDVGAAFPGYGSNHGYTATVPAAPGTRTACAYGINVQSGSVNSLIGCRTVVVPDSSPFGSLDSVVGGAGSLTASGWAIDPDTADPIQVHVYVDGGAVVTTADRSRPDVGAAFPSAGPNHGYSSTIATTRGVHTVCAYGINVGPGGNRLVGCRTVTVS